MLKSGSRPRFLWLKISNFLGSKTIDVQNRLLAPEKPLFILNEFSALQKIIFLNYFFPGPFFAFPPELDPWHNWIRILSGSEFWTHITDRYRYLPGSECGSSRIFWYSHPPPPLPPLCLSFLPPLRRCGILPAGYHHHSPPSQQQTRLYQSIKLDIPPFCQTVIKQDIYPIIVPLVSSRQDSINQSDWISLHSAKHTSNRISIPSLSP